MLPQIQSVDLLLPRYAVSFCQWLDPESFLSPFLDMIGRTKVSSIVIERRHGPLDWYGPTIDVPFLNLKHLEIACASVPLRSLSYLLNRCANLISFKLSTSDCLPPGPVFDINEAALALYSSRASLKTLKLHNHTHWPGFRSPDMSFARFGLLQDYKLEELIFDIEDLGALAGSKDWSNHLPTCLKSLTVSRFDAQSSTWREELMIS